MPVPSARHTDPEARPTRGLLDPEICQAAGPHEPWRDSGAFARFQVGAALQPKVQLCVSENSARVRLQKEETRTSKMQNADLHQRIKLRAYLLWEQAGGPRDERRSLAAR